MPYQKVYGALSVIELEFDRTLTNFAYHAVLKVCAKDASEPAARMALRILDGLRVRPGTRNSDHFVLCIPCCLCACQCSWARSQASPLLAGVHLACADMECSGVTLHQEYPVALA